ncbi:hypothetical protein [Rhodospirillum rubrum]|nr:hypothetical protein [Rhodospirillum rubrum]AEO47096.1 hypothetical protein F11_03130 [Rhodospirillum rubrum F11]QXG81093.1 hypothetical protein KUL73_03175 [Rhodospirillum rubrum]
MTGTTLFNLFILVLATGGIALAVQQSVEAARKARLVPIPIRARRTRR